LVEPKTQVDYGRKWEERGEGTSNPTSRAGLLWEEPPECADWGRGGPSKREEKTARTLSKQIKTRPRKDLRLAKPTQRAGVCGDKSIEVRASSRIGRIRRKKHEINPKSMREKQELMFGVPVGAGDHQVLRTSMTCSTGA